MPLVFQTHYRSTNFGGGSSLKEINLPKQYAAFLLVVWGKKYTLKVLQFRTLIVDSTWQKLFTSDMHTFLSTVLSDLKGRAPVIFNKGYVCIFKKIHIAIFKVNQNLRQKLLRPSAYFETPKFVSLEYFFVWMQIYS